MWQQAAVLGLMAAVVAAELGALRVVPWDVQRVVQLVVRWGLLLVRVVHWEDMALVVYVLPRGLVDQRVDAVLAGTWALEGETRAPSELRQGVVQWLVGCLAGAGRNQ
jgi:hypothetical protein